MNEFLATVPFDLYELSLFHLVAEESSFTRAGQKAGLTQSAITRQIRGVEEQLGISLFDRTTRRVCLTPAGRLLYDESKPILAATEATLHRLRGAFGLMAPTLRIGVARSIGLAYYPGFFFAFRKRHPEVQLQVQQQRESELLDLLEAGELDVGLLALTSRLPAGLTATHRFSDEFLVVTPPSLILPNEARTLPLRSARKLLSSERWLMLDSEDATARALRQWLVSRDWPIEPAMELDSFDVIANLVSLGLGVSLIPHRVLALYGPRRRLGRLAIRPRFARELAVVVRKNRVQPEPLSAFVDCILF